MTAGISADRCPVCTKNHGQPSDWPTCPQHRHWLYPLGLEVNDAKLPTGNWAYACPA